MPPAIFTAFCVFLNPLSARRQTLACLLWKFAFLFLPAYKRAWAYCPKSPIGLRGRIGHRTWKFLFLIPPSFSGECIARSAIIPLATNCWPTNRRSQRKSFPPQSIRSSRLCRNCKHAGLSFLSPLFGRSSIKWPGLYIQRARYPWSTISEKITPGLRV